MSTISEYHRYLFLGKVTGTLSEFEKQELADLFARNAAAEAEYSLFVEGLSSEDVSDSYSKLNSPGFWKDLPAEAKEKQVRINQQIWIRRSAIAAMVVTALIGTWFVWNLPGNDLHVEIAGSKNKAVQLRLSNGKVINLSTTNGQIKEDDIELHNDEKTLTYSSTSKENNGVNSISVPAGMEYHIILSDGSKIWLNSMSRLSFPTKFVDANREITVSGEAYLEVAKDKNKPFLVNIPQGQIQVTGTSFNINSYENDLSRVSLVTGGVNLITRDSVIGVRPGFQVDCTGDGKISQHRFDTKKVLSWREGIFYFEITTLNEISQVLERWYGITAVAENPALFNKKFVGVLNKNEPLTVFLDNLKIISKVDSYFDKEGILHFR